MRKLLCIFLFLLLAPSLNAQTTGFQYFVPTSTTGLTGEDYYITLQAPTTITRRAELDTVWIYCSAACTVELLRNGPPPTTTSATIYSGDENGPSSILTAYTASNVGTSTTLLSVPYAAAVEGLTLDLSGLQLMAADTSDVFAVSDTTLTSIVVDTNVGTATVPGEHGLSVGDVITIRGETVDTDLNGSYTVATTPTATTFTIATTDVSNGTYNASTLTVTTVGKNVSVGVTGLTGDASMLLRYTETSP